MRPVLAVLLTAVLPMIVGARAFRGDRMLRWLLGAPLGVVFLGAGAAAGASVATILRLPTPSALPLLVGAGLGLVALWILGSARPLTVTAPVPLLVTRVVVGLVAIVGLALLVMAFARPLLFWDSWVMWSMKSKALAATGSFDHPVFTAIEYRHTHPYYPPLLPAWQAVAYSVSGTLQVSWPLQVQVAWLWVTSGVALLLLVSRWGVTAVVLAFGWVTAPVMLTYVLSGYGELPMAGFLVIGLVLWLQGGEATRGPVYPWRNSWVPGAFLAGAALTKQEGLLIGAVVVAVLLLSPSTASVRTAFRCVSAWVFVAAGLAWLLTARLLHLENPYLSGETAAPDPAVLGVAERVWMVTVSFAGQMFAFDRWVLLVPVIVLLMFLRRPHPRLLVGAVAALVAIAVVYVFTPYDLAWQLQTSTYRVVMVPVGILALAAAVRPVRHPVPDKGYDSDPSYTDGLAGSRAGHSS